jgi:hypothetical protein
MGLTTPRPYAIVKLRARTVSCQRATRSNTVKQINKLIEILYDETGLGASLTVNHNADGWTASISEDGHILLCPAGELWLVSTGHGSAEAAVQAVEAKVAAGFKLQEQYANG